MVLAGLRLRLRTLRCLATASSHRKPREQLWNYSCLENRFVSLHKREREARRRRSKKFFFCCCATRRQKSERSKMARFEFIQLTSGLDGLGAFFFIPSWLIVGSVRLWSSRGSFLWSCDGFAKSNFCACVAIKRASTTTQQLNDYDRCAAHICK